MQALGATRHGLWQKGRGRTSWLGGAGDDVVVVGEVDCKVALEARSAVVAPQAPLVLCLRGRRWGRSWGGRGDDELPSAAGPGRRRRRGDTVLRNAQRLEHAVCVAVQVALGRARDLCRRACVDCGRVVCGRPLPRVCARRRGRWPGRRVWQLLDGPLVVAEDQQGPAPRGAARRDGRGAQAAVDVVARGRRKRRRHGVGHYCACYGAFCSMGASSSQPSRDATIEGRATLGRVKSKTHQVRGAASLPTSLLWACGCERVTYLLFAPALEHAVTPEPATEVRLSFTFAKQSLAFFILRL